MNEFGKKQLLWAEIVGYVESFPGKFAKNISNPYYPISINYSGISHTIFGSFNFINLSDLSLEDMKSIYSDLKEGSIFKLREVTKAQHFKVHIQDGAQHHFSSISQLVVFYKQGKITNMFINNDDVGHLLNFCQSLRMLPSNPLDTNIHQATVQISQESVQIPFNLNSYVSVKLTEKGLEVFAAHKWKSQFDTSVTIKDIKRDHVSEDGYTKIQMWELANIFGDHIKGMHIPEEAVFADMNVLLEVRE